MTFPLGRDKNSMSGRSRTVIRIESVYRKALLHYLHSRLSLILVTEYPKSGASWLCQMLAQQTGYDFPRQRFPRLTPSVMHGHYLKKSVSGPTVVFWRDPRDIMVSWYYHSLFKSDKNNHDLVDHVCSELSFSDVNDIKANLPGFIEYSFERSSSPKFNLNQFIDTWHGRQDVVHSSYEKLQNDTLSEFRRVCDQLGLDHSDDEKINRNVNDHSFQSQSSRKPGDENTSSYLRKGIVGDWVNCFSDEAIREMNLRMGDRLSLLGYEQS